MGRKSFAVSASSPEAKTSSYGFCDDGVTDGVQWRKEHRNTVSFRLRMRYQCAEASTYRRNKLIGRQSSREGLPAFRTEAITRNSELWILSQMMHDKKRTQENGQFSVADAKKKCRSCDLPS